MRLDKTTIRWMLVIPSAWAAWCMAVLVGILVYSIGNALCPPELMESGGCGASWYPLFFKSTIIFCASISAIFTVLAGSYMAPTHRATVAKAIFITGSAFAIFMVVDTKEYLALVGALLCGAGSMLFVIKQSGVSNST
jgi:hypothetical protein